MRYIQLIVEVDDIFVPPKMRVVGASRCGWFTRLKLYIERMLRRDTLQRNAPSIAISPVNIEVDGTAFSEFIGGLTDDAIHNMTLVTTGSTGDIYVV